jgi:hypothetical protein
LNKISIADHDDAKADKIKSVNKSGNTDHDADTSEADSQAALDFFESKIPNLVDRNEEWSRSGKIPN